jgi:2-polyprenyl-3-methyl-5-hydroxy-6-metoxy-1,4-benzoquinol methylase
MDSVYESDVDPLRANNSHAIALQLIGHNKRVLEIGAAGGHVTKAIKSQDNYVFAVERDGRFKADLQNIADDVVITDLDWLDLRSKCNKHSFEVILAGDVLEHCLHPDLVMLQFHDLLSADGFIVLSIPNVAHGDVRLSLLTGHFDYRETGLLDHTHIRFFTRATLDNFLERNGFEIDQIYGTTAELGTTEFGPVSPEIPSAAIDYVRSDRDSNIYQFVLKAFPSNTFISTTPEPYAITNNHAVDTLLAQISEYQSLATSRGYLVSDLDRLRQEVDSLLSDLHELRVHTHNITQELEDSKSQYPDSLREDHHLALKLLSLQDSMIGLSAQKEEAQHRLQKQRKNHQKHLSDIYSSQTWKIGRVITLPLRLIKRLLRRS